MSEQLIHEQIVCELPLVLFHPKGIKQLIRVEERHGFALVTAEIVPEASPQNGDVGPFVTCAAAAQVQEAGKFPVF